MHGGGAYLKLDPPSLLAGLLLAGLLLPAAAVAHPLPQEAQEGAAARELRIEPRKIVLDVGETARIDARVVDASGEEVEAKLLFLSRGRRTVSVTREGVVQGIKPGTVEIIVRERQEKAGENQEGRANVGARLSGTVEVTVRPPALERLELITPAAGVFQGTAVTLGLRAVDVNGDEREEPRADWASSAPEIASFDAHGELTVHGTGAFRVTATLDGKQAAAALKASVNPIARVVIDSDLEAPRTGDVLRLRVDAYDAGGELVLEVPVDMTFMARPDDTLGPGASGQIEAVPARPARGASWPSSRAGTPSSRAPAARWAAGRCERTHETSPASSSSSGTLPFATRTPPTCGSGRVSTVATTA